MSVLIALPCVIITLGVFVWERVYRMNQRIDAEHHNRYWSNDTEAARVELHQRANQVPQRGRRVS